MQKNFNRLFYCKDVMVDAIDKFKSALQTLKKKREIDIYNKIQKFYESPNYPPDDEVQWDEVYALFEETHNFHFGETKIEDFFVSI